jgi:hypothetical protein
MKGIYVKKLDFYYNSYKMSSPTRLVTYFDVLGTVN